MSVRGDTSWVIYTPVFPIFNYNENILLISLHIIHFCAILQVEFVGVLRSIPLRRNEIRSILGDDCPLSFVQLRGQIRLKDTTSFRWTRICLLLSKCLFSLQVCFLHYLFMFSERTERRQQKITTNTSPIHMCVTNGSISINWQVY